MNVQPYLFFDGKCEEALDFYKQTIGAEPKMLMRFKDAPDQSMVSPGFYDKIMHAQVQIGDTAVLMSDGRCLDKATFHGFALTINATSEAEADMLFGALSEGGQVTMPLAKTFFAARFGMLTDKFGVGWMVLAQ
jgi:PhnB protein